ncbi:MAG: glycerophosphodiester phosphodiesterase [Bilifractor sp.]|jgi:glycerophosphoryl diester phosphodiesterase
MNTPFVWAHRGASGYAPENTLEAFRLAAEMGADGVELDVQLTRDNQIVVCHDETIDRTSDGAGWVKDYTLEELKKMNFDNGNKAYEGAGIPTMQEVFDALRDTGLVINIELKTGIVFYQDLEKAIVKMTQENHYEDRVIYSSFNHYSVMKIKELDPKAKTGFLYADGTLDMPSYAKNHGVDALHPALYNLQFPGFMDECREKGVEVNVWTVNNEEYLKMCQNAGVNAVITNYPKKALELFGRK